MADQVRMRSKNTFHNERITAFFADGPVEGQKGRTVVPGVEFTTDVLHAKELARAGHADPLGWSVDAVDDPPLEPGHQVSVPQLLADRASRATRAAEKALGDKLAADKAAAAKIAADAEAAKGAAAKPPAAVTTAAPSAPAAALARP